jgi:transposase
VHPGVDDCSRCRALALYEAEKKQLRRISRHRSTPHGVLLRVEIVRAAAEGIANRAIARKLSTSLPTVLLWRRRYEAEGLACILEDRPRSGRPKQISVGREAAIVDATLKTRPSDATQWSVRAMAKAQKVSPATVYRIWKRHKLQPHRVESFKFSEQNVQHSCRRIGSKRTSKPDEQRYAMDSPRNVGLKAQKCGPRVSELMIQHSAHFNAVVMATVASKYFDHTPLYGRRRFSA